MKLSNKLRELLAIPTGLMAQPIDWDSVDLELSRSDAETLLAEAERLEEKIRSLEVDLSIREGDLNDARETIEAAKAALDKEGTDEAR